MAETKSEQSLVKTDIYNNEEQMTNDYVGDIKAQAQEFGVKFQDAALKAKDYATEKFGQVSDKIKELDGKDPKELLEDAKNYARQKPGEALLVSAAVGLLVGLILKGRR